MIPKKGWNKDNSQHESQYKNKHDDSDKHNPPKNPPMGGQGAKPKKPKPSGGAPARAVSITPGESLIKPPSYSSVERAK